VRISKSQEVKKSGKNEKVEKKSKKNDVFLTQISNNKKYQNQ